MISSAIVVKIIGASAVPFAYNFAPLATNKAVAFGPVPASPLIIVPASIVNSAPASTAILPPRTYTLSDVHVVLVVMFDVTIMVDSSAGYVHEPSSFSASVL